MLTVLDLVTEMKREVSWRRPRPKIGLVGPQENNVKSYRFYCYQCCEWLILEKLLYIPRLSNDPYFEKPCSKASVDFF
jgi:hypothetical protein